LIHPDDCENAVRTNMDCIEGRREHFEVEFRMKAKSSGWRWILGRGKSTARNEEGRAHRMVGTHVDITERKKAEREMVVLAKIGRLISSTLEINEVYEQFAQQVQELVSFDRLSVDLNNPDGKTSIITYVSGFDIPGRRSGDAITLAGTISETILRTRTGLLINMVNPKEINGQFPHLTNVSTIRAGMLSLISVPLISRNKVIGTLHFRSRRPNAYTDQDLRLAERIGDQIAGAIANAQLYSDLRTSEGELRRSEEKFRELVEHINDIFYELDKDGIIQYASPSIEHITGHCQSEVIGRSIINFLDPEYTVSAVENVQKAFGGHVAPHEYRIRRKSGDICWIRVSSSPVRRGDKVVGIRGVMSDITDRRRAEDALQETLGHLESRVQERTIELEETNTALRVLLKKGDKDQKAMEENLQSNVNQLVTPFLSKLRVSRSNPERLLYLNILEENLNNIVSPFINQLSVAYRNLTPKEIQIAELIRQGKRSKEIAELMSISVRTVDVLRYSVRKKLGLNKKKANLQSLLSSL
jgi:PAS domain S-box-containing protein